MALILEDGSKPNNANSYTTIEFADNYHELMGNTDWAGYDITTKTSSLIKATDSIDMLYGPRYMSMKYPGMQSLLWPRYVFVDQNSIIRQNHAMPVELMKAVSVLALAILNGLDPYPLSTNDANIKQQKTKVGDIETNVLYRTPVDTETFPGFNLVELILRPILKQKGSHTVTLGR